MPTEILNADRPVRTEPNRVLPLYTDRVCDRAHLPEDARFEKHLLAVLDRAREFVFIEIFGFERQDVVARLVERARAGVRVFLTIDPPDEEDDYERQKLVVLTELQSLLGRDRELARFIHLGFLPLLPERTDADGRTVRWAQIDHHKVVIADDGAGGIVEVSGGINLGLHSGRNYDVAMRLEGPAATTQLRHLIELHGRSLGVDGSPRKVDPDLADAMLARAQARTGRAAVWVGRSARYLERSASGESVERITASYETLVRDAVRHATNEVLIACYAFTDVNFQGRDHYLFETLRQRRSSGVQVRVVVDTLDIEGRFVNEGTVHRLASAGLDVRYFEPGHSGDFVPGEENQTKLHAKVAVVDGRSTLIGSANWSRNGFRFNMEAGKRVDCEEFAASVKRDFFEPLWDLARPVSVPVPVPPERRRPFLEGPPGPSAPLRGEVVYVVFDLETTGFSADTDRIIQIAAVSGRYRDGRFAELGTFDEFVNPGVGLSGLPISIPPEVAELTGIDDATVEGLDQEGPVLERFAEWVRAQPGPVVLVGHNVPFDYRLLQAAYLRTSGWEVREPLVDTLALSRNTTFPPPEPGERGAHSLESVMRRLGLEPPSGAFHNALTDVRVTGRVFVGLVEAGRSRDLQLETLGDLDGYGSRVRPEETGAEDEPYEPPSQEEMALVDALLEATAAGDAVAERRKELVGALDFAEAFLVAEARRRDPTLDHDAGEVRLAGGGVVVRVASGAAVEWVEQGEERARALLAQLGVLGAITSGDRMTLSVLDGLRSRDRAEWGRLRKRHVVTGDPQAPRIRVRRGSSRARLRDDEKSWIATLHASREMPSLLAAYARASERREALDAELKVMDEEPERRARRALLAYRERIGTNLRLWSANGDAVSIHDVRRREIRDEEALRSALAAHGIHPAVSPSQLRDWLAGDGSGRLSASQAQTLAGCIRRRVRVERVV